MEFCYKLNYLIFYYKLKRNDEDQAYNLLKRAVKEKKYEFVYLFMDHGIDISKLQNFRCLINVVSF
jgi:hypothetical protein